MLKRSLLTMLACLILSSPSLAKRDQIGNFIADPSCKQARYESEILACMTVEFKHYDRQSNHFASEIIKLLGKADANEFKKAQMAWQTSVDKNCEFLYKFDNAKIRRIMTISCKILKSKKRRSELSSLFKKLGGVTED